MTDYQYNPQQDVTNLRTRVNSLEDTCVRNETKLNFLTTISSLAFAAVTIELASRFIN